jgi:membrane protein YdbS with pleckstrin-like domain
VPQELRRTTDGPRAIHAAVQKVWLVESGISQLILASFTILLEFFFLRKLGGSWRIPVVMPLLWVVIFCWGVAMVKRRWRSWSYEVTDFEVILRWGVWQRVQRFVPRDRVQHVDITSGPIARKLGLVHFHLYVAGAHGSIGAIPGLTPTEAEELRDMLVESQAEHV